MRVALCHSKGRFEGLREELERAGHEIVLNPLVKTTSIQSKAVRQASKELLECQWLFFSSRSAVEAWAELGLPFKQQIATVGQKTADAVIKNGGKVRLVGKPASAEGLVKQFLISHRKAKSVALPQGEKALDIIPKALENFDIPCKPLVIYRNELLTWHSGEVDLIVLTSPSAVEALPISVAIPATLLAIGPTTGDAIEAKGLSFYLSKSPDIVDIAVEVARIQKDQDHLRGNVQVFGQGS